MSERTKEIVKKVRTGINSLLVMQERACGREEEILRIKFKKDRILALLEVEIEAIEMKVKI